MSGVLDEDRETEEADWLVWVGGNDEWHTMTRDMLQTHAVFRDCWCRPELVDDVITHNDRERYA